MPPLFLIGLGRGCLQSLDGNESGAVKNRCDLNAAGPAKPLSIGFFGGRLEYGRLAWWAVMFVMLVIQAPAGDRRNWPAIRAWAAGLAETFQNSGNSNL